MNDQNAQSTSNNLENLTKMVLNGKIQFLQLFTPSICLCSLKSKNLLNFSQKNFPVSSPIFQSTSQAIVFVLQEPLYVQVPPFHATSSRHVEKCWLATRSRVRRCVEHNSCVTTMRCVFNPTEIQQQFAGEQ